jgi:hypothetical protein
MIDKICSVEGCGGKVLAKGLCQRHYLRLWRHGDPLGGGPHQATPQNLAPRGAPLAWIEAHLDYDSAACLAWPFTRNSHGYGELWIDGKRFRAHRYMCERTHGPAPGPKYEATHTCGKGHEGCSNPRHLVWNTHQGNMLDKRIHGTELLGERSRFAKLTEDDVRFILMRAGTTKAMGIARGVRAQLMREFGVSPATIDDITHGRTWRHL